MCLRLASRLFACTLCLPALCSVAPAATPVRYSITLTNPEKHYLGVTMQLDPGPAPYVDVRMPVWNALYQVQDFAQYVSQVQVRGSNARVEKLDLSTWRVIPEAPGPVTLGYRVFADRAGPFGTQLDSRHAFINPAQVLMYADTHRRLPVELRLEGIPPGWRVATALTGQDGTWPARDYDHLADSPFEISPFEETSFTGGGGNYRIVVHADGGSYSMPELRRLVERIVTFQTGLMRDVPFSRFTFLYHFHDGAGGGMEHSDSTAIDAGPPRNERAAESLAWLTAHEFFHLWNVKRIRPQSLEPVDYSRAQPTRALWFSEGFTSTAGTYTLLRTGVTNAERFLEKLADDIRSLEERPARLDQSLEESSLETWLEKYGYYNGPERSISYYLKGELVGIMLDLAIRHATANRRSLDDVFRYLNERYAKNGKFLDERRDIQAAAEAVAGHSLAPLFRQLVQSSEPVPYGQYLEYAGYALQKQERPAAALGLHASRGTGRVLQIDTVESRSPAERAGVRVGDELLAVNGRPPRGDVPQTTREIEPGSKLRLKLRRNGREFEARYKTGRASAPYLVLDALPSPSPLQQKVRAGWLLGMTNEE